MLWVKAPEKGETWGPYENSRWDNIKTFARIGSQYGSKRVIVHGESLRGGNVVRVYVGGERKYPVHMTPDLRAREKQMISRRVRKVRYA